MMRTPVTFKFVQLIGAGASFQPLTAWQYETPDSDCMIEVLANATAIGLFETITSGGETIEQESPVGAGGAAGTYPARLNLEPTVGQVKAFQKVILNYRNPTGGGQTVNGVVILTPLKGGR